MHKKNKGIKNEQNIMEDFSSIFCNPKIFD